MPGATERITELREQAEEGELPYISKSRLKTFVSCPRKFYYNYILGIRGPENWHMKKGTRIHFTFEEYYHNVCEFYEANPDADLPSTPDDLVKFLPDDGLLYVDWAQPFIGSFIAWELKRFQTSLDVATEKLGDEPDESVESAALMGWLPAGIESEAWDDEELIPWMGFADVIVPSASVPEVDSDDGVVIVDFKTGKTPDKKYRDHGIYLEGEYYGMLFKDDFQVEGVAGYFPMNHDFIVSPLSDERREFIRESIRELHENETDKDQFEPETGPLCKWGADSADQCDYYSMCHAGKEWGQPTEDWEAFVEDVNNDVGWGVLLDRYYDGEDVHDSLGYWKYKAGQEKYA